MHVPLFFLQKLEAAYSLMTFKLKKTIADFIRSSVSSDVPPVPSFSVDLCREVQSL